MTTTDKPPFDAVAAAAECMQWPTIAEAVRNYHNNNGSADSVFKLIHDDYRLGEAAQIVDVLLKRGKYAEDTPAAPVIPQPLQEIDALQRRISELEVIKELHEAEIEDKRKSISRLNDVLMNVMMELDIFSGWLTTTYEENQASIIEAIQALKKAEAA